jgi:hypothetical protein
MIGIYGDTKPKDEFYSLLRSRINLDADITDSTPCTQIVNNEIWVDRTVCACSANQIWLLALVFNTAILEMEACWKSDVMNDYSGLQKRVCDIITLYISGHSSHDTFSKEISMYTSEVKKVGRIIYGIQ